MMNKSYYADGRKYEPIDVISDWDLDFFLGNALKYISRVGRKGELKDWLSDIDKAIDYLKYEQRSLIYQSPEYLKGGELTNRIIKEIEDAYRE